VPCKCWALPRPRSPRPAPEWLRASASPQAPCRVSEESDCLVTKVMPKSSPRGASPISLHHQSDPPSSASCPSPMRRLQVPAARNQIPQLTSEPGEQQRKPRNRRPRSPQRRYPTRRRIRESREGRPAPRSGLSREGGPCRRAQRQPLRVLRAVQARAESLRADRTPLKIEANPGRSSACEVSRYAPQTFLDS
jgi:hypothetical protein